MGIVVIGAVFVDIKGYPLSTYIPGGRNAGRVEQMHGGVSHDCFGHSYFTAVSRAETGPAA